MNVQIPVIAFNGVDPAGTPCPFCGSHNLYHQAAIDGQGVWCCDDCDAAWEWDMAVTGVQPGSLPRQTHTTKGSQPWPET